jgi:hypothetical protein
VPHAESKEDHNFICLNDCPILVLDLIIIISYNQLREVDFLSGGSYNLVQIGVPVYFSGKRDRLEGTLALVIWENKTQPIIGGREEDGMPKIHADIQDLHVLQQKYFTIVSYEGNTFLRLGMIRAEHVSGQELEAARGANSLELTQLA